MIIKTELTAEIVNQILRIGPEMYWFSYVAGVFFVKKRPKFLLKRNYDNRTVTMSTYFNDF